MSRVLLRADGGKSIGLGHVLRCVALATGLADHGFEPVLALKLDGLLPADLKPAVEYQTEFIPNDISLDEDACLTAEIASENGVQWIVLDLCHSGNLLNPSFDLYLTSMRRRYRTVCLTGSGRIDYDADCVVSPYYRTSFPPAPSDSGRVFLLGPEYFIFRKEFQQACGSERKTPEFASRILVTIGGSDEFDATGKVARALSQCVNVAVRFIVGPAYREGAADRIRQTLSGTTTRYSILHECESMAGEMAQVDVAVIGDGLTKYEAAVLGLPCITVSRPNSDEVLNSEFAKIGSSLHLGDVTCLEEGRLGKDILSLCADRDIRMAMASRGRELVDGSGITRIAAAMETQQSLTTGSQS